MEGVIIMTATLIILASAVLIGLAFAAFNYFGVKRMDEGSPLMQKVASATSR